MYNNVLHRLSWEMTTQNTPKSNDQLYSTPYNGNDYTTESIDDLTHSRAPYYSTTKKMSYKPFSYSYKTTQSTPIPLRTTGYNQINSYDKTNNNNRYNNNARTTTTKKTNNYYNYMFNAFSTTTSPIVASIYDNKFNGKINKPNNYKSSVTASTTTEDQYGRLSTGRGKATFVEINQNLLQT